MTAPHLLSATAFVVTPRPERYIKQLVSHFGNKVRTELTLRYLDSLGDESFWSTCSQRTFDNSFTRRRVFAPSAQFALGMEASDSAVELR